MFPYQIFIIVQNCLNVIKQIKNNAGSKEGGYLKAAYSPKDQKVIFRSVDPGSGVWKSQVDIIVWDWIESRSQNKIWSFIFLKNIDCHCQALHCCDLQFEKQCSETSFILLQNWIPNTAAATTTTTLLLWCVVGGLSCCWDLFCWGVTDSSCSQTF